MSVTPSSEPLATAERIELSIVLPCLNEADTLEVCVRKAMTALAEHGIDGEVIVADNGSEDGSPEIAARHGARVVAVPQRGYGSALGGGIAASRGRYIVMADADDSYDLREAPAFLVRLREGADLVQGCRLPAGGGRVMPGAMPASHRWLGNPLLSRLATLMFRVPVHDIYCGMRGFSRALYDRLDLRCTGMEFATEMIVKASLHRASIVEIPITLHRDGRVSHQPHLRTIRDGWRTLRFFLVYSPRWLFLVPGLLLIAAGLLGYGLALPAMRIAGATFDVHTLLVASLSLLLGYQTVLFGIFAKTFAVAERLVPPDSRLDRLAGVVSLERGLALGAIALVAGLALIARVGWSWWGQSFGPLDYPSTMRVVIPGVTMAALGFQTILSSFFISVLGLRRL